MPATKTKDTTHLMIPLSAAISALAAAFGIWFALVDSMERAIELHVKHGHPETIRPEEIEVLRTELYRANQEIQALRDHLYALKNRKR